jgi:hypothetical protein
VRTTTRTPRQKLAGVAALALLATPLTACALEDEPVSNEGEPNESPQTEQSAPEPVAEVVGLPGISTAINLNQGFLDALNVTHGGDLVALRSDRDLAEHETQPMVEGGNQMRRGNGLGACPAATVLGVDRDHSPTLHLAGPGPGEHAELPGPARRCRDERTSCAASTPPVLWAGPAGRAGRRATRPPGR